MALEQSFASQVVVITGGASGIGLGVGHYLGARGATICVLDMSADANAAAVAELSAKGVTARAAVCNVADEANWVAALTGFFGEFGRLDALVQCAGVTGKTGIKTADVETDNFDFVMRVNVRVERARPRARAPAPTRAPR